MCVLVRHGGVDVRRLILAVIAGMAFAGGVSTAGMALDEQQAPVTPTEEQGAKAAVQEGGSAAKPAESGTEIRIPGLGKLGTLPKMDFGLELLYGVDGKPNAQDADPAPSSIDDQQDLTVRGSVKHRF
jgi:hypothetical protein